MTVRRSLLLLGVGVAAWTTQVTFVTGEVPAETAADIVLVGPASGPLPTRLELMSSQAHMVIPREFGCYTGDVLAPGRQACEPYFLGREGPDANGQYHYFWQLPTAAPGEVHLEVIAWTDDPTRPDRETIDFMATSSGLVRGDVHTCLAPKIRAGGGRLGYLELSYYSQRSSTAVVIRRLRSKLGWGAPELVARANFPVGEDLFAPYMRRSLRLRVNRGDLLHDRLRMAYYVLPGNNYDPLGSRSGVPFSMATCLPPGGI
jgi:hypothetical protein